MNKERRNAISKIEDELGEIQARIDELLGEEQEAVDNMPESLQYSDPVMAMREAAEQLEYASGAIEDVLGYLSEAKGEG